MENEKWLSIVVNNSHLETKQLTDAIRDFIKYIDPKADLIWVADTEREESASFVFDPDKYPLMSKHVTTPIV